MKRVNLEITHRQAQHSKNEKTCFIILTNVFSTWNLGYLNLPFSFDLSAIGHDVEQDGCSVTVDVQVHLSLNDSEKRSLE